MPVLLVSVAFVIGVGLVVGAYLGATRVPGMLMRRKLDSAAAGNLSDARPARRGDR